MSTNIKKCFVNSNEVKAIYVNDDIVYAKEYTITVNISNGSYSGNNKINYKGNETITLTADTGYNLPSTISVTNALYTYNDETGIIYLQEPSGNVVINATCSIISYPINVSVINGSYSGDASINYGSTASVTISANSGYDLPSSITVSGASYTYNSSTGVISLSTPSGNVTISATCEAQSTGYILTMNNGSTIGLTYDAPTYIKLNTAPSSASDYDYVTTPFGLGDSGFKDSGGNTITPPIVINDVSKIYAWGGYADITDSSYNSLANCGSTYNLAGEYTLTADITVLVTDGCED